MKATFLSPVYLIAILLLLISCNSNKKEPEEIHQDSIDIAITELYERSKISDNDSIKDSLAYALQRLDSAMLIAQQHQKDSLFLKCLSRKSKLYKDDKDINKALDYADSLSFYADSLNNTYYKGKALFKLGMYNDDLENYLIAYDYYVQSKEVFSKRNDSVEVAKRLLNMSTIQKNVGDYQASKKTAVDGLRFLENNKHKTEYKLYNVLSSTSMFMDDFEDAMSYRDSSILKAKENNNTLSLIKYYNNKSLIYSKQEKYIEARKILDSISRLEILQKREKGNIKAKARLLSNFGIIKFKLNEPDALEYLQEAYQLRDSLDDDLGLSSSYEHLFDYYNTLKQPDSALYYAQQVYYKGIEMNSLMAQKNGLSYMLLLQEEYPNKLIKNTSDKYFKKYQQIEDSLEVLAYETREIYADDKYNIEREREINKATQSYREKIQSVQIKWSFSIVGFIVLILFLLLIMRHRREKIKQNYQAEIRMSERVYETERHLSKRVHDEVANDVYALMTEIDHAFDGAKKEQLLDKLEGLYHRSRDISRATNDINTTDFVNTVKELLNGYAYQDCQVLTKGLSEIDWEQLPPHKKVVLFRVIQELMTNMAKHSEASTVLLRCQQEHKQIVLHYADNGQGVDLNSVAHFNGMQNAENRIGSIGGLLIFDSSPGKGFKATIELPV